MVNESIAREGWVMTAIPSMAKTVSCSLVVTSMVEKRAFSLDFAGREAAAISPSADFNFSNPVPEQAYHVYQNKNGNDQSLQNSPTT